MTRFIRKASRGCTTTASTGDAFAGWLVAAGFEAVVVETVHVVTKDTERDDPVFAVCARRP